MIKVTGVVFILVAALIHKSNQGYEITDRYEIPMVPRFLYIAGGVSIFTGFVGVIAMLLGRLKIVLCLYVVLIVCLIGLELALIGLASGYRDEAKNTTRKYLVEKMTTYNESFVYQLLWDEFQQDGECCGLESSEDWVEAKIEVPDSCCHKDLEDCDTSNKKHIYKDGCLQFMFDTVDTIINIIIIVTVVVLSIQGVAVALAVLLFVFGTFVPCV